MDNNNNNNSSIIINKKLNLIQQKLNVPKNQLNKFGGYKYRSCEDILMSVKPLLNETNTVLTLSDDVLLAGDRFYIKATATLRDCESDAYISNTGFAHEPAEKKGCDPAQITGASSSYARKYALNGLFAIDDSKDPDTNEYKAETNKPKPAEKIICPVCGKEVKNIKKSDGSVVSAKAVFDSCGGMCYNCYKSKNNQGVSK